jgi:hypothetical protein
MLFIVRVLAVLYWVQKNSGGRFGFLKQAQCPKRAMANHGLPGIVFFSKRAFQITYF